MRKLLLAVAVTLGLAAIAQAVCDSRTTTCLTAIDVSGNATVGSLTLSGVATPYARTIAQLNALAPGAAGQTVFCSNCSKSALCVSSGTASGAWVVVAISTQNTGNYTDIHCQ